jgi:hypothetical protein
MLHRKSQWCGAVFYVKFACRGGGESVTERKFAVHIQLLRFLYLILHPSHAAGAYDLISKVFADAIHSAFDSLRDLL